MCLFPLLDDGDARLVNTTRPGSGIVEILQDGTWTSIESTTTSFDPNELCRQLGFEQGSQINVSVNSTGTNASALPQALFLSRKKNNFMHDQ